MSRDPAPADHRPTSQGPVGGAWPLPAAVRSAGLSPGAGAWWARHTARVACSSCQPA
jgi:hypothetical protein